MRWHMLSYSDSVMLKITWGSKIHKIHVYAIIRYTAELRWFEVGLTRSFPYAQWSPYKVKRASNRWQFSVKNYPWIWKKLLILGFGNLVSFLFFWIEFFNSQFPFIGFVNAGFWGFWEKITKTKIRLLLKYYCFCCCCLLS